MLSFTKSEFHTHVFEFSRPMKIGLFVTCLVDLMRPQVGFAAIELIRKAGYSVTVPQTQTCCGQPAWNSGDAASTAPIARQVIKTFASFDYVVVPSGSCAGMIREHYPELFNDDLRWQQKARDLAARTFELTSFLKDVLNLELEQKPGNYKVAYHDSCSGLRELGIYSQPRSLMEQLQNSELTEIAYSEACCGFGGTFCVKYPDISSKMADDKVKNVEATGAEVLLGGDLGCLLNISGRMRRIGCDTRVMHIAEWLNGNFAGVGLAATEEHRQADQASEADGADPA